MLQLQPLRSCERLPAWTVGHRNPLPLMSHDAGIHGLRRSDNSWLAVWRGDSCAEAQVGVIRFAIRRFLLSALPSDVRGLPLLKWGLHLIESSTSWTNPAATNKVKSFKASAPT